MRITPLDARKQEFRKVVRGYDCDEVRAFLTTLADEYETVLVDNKQLRERIMEQEDKIGEYKTMERTLRDTLMTAERLMQDTRDSAGKEGELIVRDARLKARQVLEECRVRTEELRRELVSLRKEKETYLARFKSLAEAQINFIDTHRNDFKDLDQRLISMVDAVIEGVDASVGGKHDAPAAQAAQRPAAQRPAAQPAVAPRPAPQPVWTDAAEDAEEAVDVPAPAAPPAAHEPDIWRDYQPLSRPQESAPAAQPAAAHAPTPAPAPAAEPQPAARSEPEPHAEPEPQAAQHHAAQHHEPQAEHDDKPRFEPSRPTVPEANPWASGGWGPQPAAAEGSDEADQAVAALHEKEPEPAPAAAVW